jgi:hypothetical protein
MLGVLLFAHAALAAAACDMPDRAPTQAIVQTTTLPCHEESAKNANLCLAHCLSADQSADTPQFVVPAWIDFPPIIVTMVDHNFGRVENLRFVLPRPSAPPPRILFQSFLI